MEDASDKGNFFLKTLIKQLPRLDKVVVKKSLLHSISFSEMARGLKLLIVSDSHVKFTPNAPGDL